MSISVTSVYNGDADADVYFIRNTDANGNTFDQLI